jgi:hypothetical protein
MKSYGGVKVELLSFLVEGELLFHPEKEVMVSIK